VQCQTGALFTYSEQIAATFSSQLTRSINVHKRLNKMQVQGILYKNLSISILLLILTCLSIYL